MSFQIRNCSRCMLKRHCINFTLCYNYGMKISYQYKLVPSTDQKATMNRWLDMLRHQYNWLLPDRFRWWEENRCEINACPLVCHLPELRSNPYYYSQKRSLVPFKQDRPWYKDIHSQFFQHCVNRVKLIFDRFIKVLQSRARVPRVEGTGVDSNGNKSGQPRFKGNSRYRSFTYTQISNKALQENRINLSKIDWFKLILHRSITSGFKAKTASVTLKPDGWYVSLSLEDLSVPEFINQIEPTCDNSIAIDLGLEKFLADSQGNFEAVPQFFRKASGHSCRHCGLEADRDTKRSRGTTSAIKPALCCEDAASVGSTSQTRLVLESLLMIPINCEVLCS